MVRSLTVVLQSTPGAGRLRRGGSVPGGIGSRSQRALFVALTTAALLAGLLAGGAVADAGTAAGAADAAAAADETAIAGVPAPGGVSASASGSALADHDERATGEIDQTVAAGDAIAARNSSDTASGWRVENRSAEVTDVEEGPDGERLYAGGADGTVWVLDADDGELLRSFEADGRIGTHEVEGPVRDLEIGPDGARLYAAVGNGNGVVSALDVESGQPVESGAWPKDIGRTPYAIEVGPAGDVVYAADGTFAYGVDAETGTLTWWEQFDDTLADVAVDPDDGTVYVATRDETVVATNPATEGYTWTRSIGSPISALAVVPAATHESSVDGGSLLIANGSTIQSLSADDGRQRWATPLWYQTYGLAVGHDDAEVVVAQYDGTTSYTQRVHLATGKLGEPRAFSEEEIRDVEFLGQGPYEAAVDAQFEATDDEPVVGQPLAFKAYDSVGEIDEYQWSFGDGTEASSRGGWQEYAYDEPGEYTVELTVVAESGATATATRTVSVSSQNESAEIDAGVAVNETQQTVGEDVAFDASDTTGDVERYWWDFDDPRTAITAAPTAEHSFAAPGTYEVTLVAIGEDAVDETNVTVTVGSDDSTESLDAAFTVERSDPMVGQGVTFDADASTGSVAEYRWNLSGQRETTEFPFVTHAFESAGEHAVELTVVAEDGESDTVAKTVTVREAELAARFDVSDHEPVVGQPLAFGAYDSSGDIAEYRWSFGDGTDASSSYSAWQEHTYEEPGTYAVELTVVGEDGETNVATRTVSVASQNESAAIDASVDVNETQPSVGESVAFDASASDGAIQRYYWQFDDGRTSRTGAATIEHSFRERGTYNVTFVAIGEDAVDETHVEIVVGGACQGAAVNSTEVEDRTVCDLDGDGLHRDVTGDGTVGQTDVVTFFRHQHRDAWKRPALFDFTGDGTVGHGDVVALFEHVATA